MPDSRVFVMRRGSGGPADGAGWPVCPTSADAASTCGMRGVMSAMCTGIDVAHMPKT